MFQTFNYEKCFNGTNVILCASCLKILIIKTLFTFWTLGKVNIEAAGRCMQESKAMIILETILHVCMVDPRNKLRDFHMSQKVKIVQITYHYSTIQNWKKKPFRLSLFRCKIFFITKYFQIKNDFRKNDFFFAFGCILENALENI